MSTEARSCPPGEHGLDVLVASDDRNFLRLAGVLLGNDGHRTVRSPASPARIARLARLRAPSVLVLDAHEDAVVVAEVCSSLLAAGSNIGLVLVCDEEQRSPGLPVIARWGSPESLLLAVRRARQDGATATADVAARGLRLVVSPPV